MVDAAYDEGTGEILPGPERAADGGVLSRPARTFGEFVRMINDGQFDSDVMHDLQNAAADLQDMAAAQGGKAKGKLTITVDIEVEGDQSECIIYLRGAHKIAIPTQKRSRSVVWTDEHNNFTANKPRQGQLFSQPREVGGTTRVRDTGSTTRVRS